MPILVDNPQKVGVDRLLNALAAYRRTKTSTIVIDFGMSYSSLHSWHAYPFKSLKIDRTFIQGVNTNNSDLSLVNSIIAMSRNLKLTVVAEGIETAEQLNLMRAMNCDMVQGWYFSAALSSDQFLSYLNNELKHL